MFVNAHFRQNDIILIPIFSICSIIVITTFFPVISIERAQGFLDNTGNNRSSSSPQRRPAASTPMLFTLLQLARRQGFQMASASSRVWGWVGGDWEGRRAPDPLRSDAATIFRGTVEIRIRMRPHLGDDLVILQRASLLDARGS